MKLVAQIVVNSNLELVWKAWTEADRHKLLEAGMSKLGSSCFQVLRAS
ncbi:hypothetical protein HGO21_02240 [Acinetobacter sp. CUI P1]|nr:hypothetical protein [Acinetobacter sp. CUI P1]